MASPGWLCVLWRYSCAGWCSLFGDGLALCGAVGGTLWDVKCRVATRFAMGVRPARRPWRRAVCYALCGGRLRATCALVQEGTLCVA